MYALCSTKPYRYLRADGPELARWYKSAILVLEACRLLQEWTQKNMVRCSGPKDRIGT